MPSLNGRQITLLDLATHTSGLVEPDGSRRALTFGEAGEGARPLAASSAFEIGSITKTSTGAVLADMVRRGSVKLDDPVGKYMQPDHDALSLALVDIGAD